MICPIQRKSALCTHKTSLCRLFIIRSSRLTTDWYKATARSFLTNSNTQHYQTVWGATAADKSFCRCMLRGLALLIGEWEMKEKGSVPVGPVCHETWRWGSWSSKSPTGSRATPGLSTPPACTQPQLLVLVFDHSKWQPNKPSGLSGS